jgi:hypothetical protein
LFNIRTLQQRLFLWFFKNEMSTLNSVACLETAASKIVVYLITVTVIISALMLKQAPRVK